MAAEFSFYPFDAGPGSVVFEAEWSDMMSWMRTNGILSINDPLDPATNDLAVTPYTLFGLQVQVAVGEAWVEGFYFKQSGDIEILDIPENSSGDPRIDLVALQLETDTNLMQYVVVEGVPDPAPVAPVPVQNSTIWQLPLAHVEVASGATILNPGDVTDVRVHSMQGGAGSSAVTLTSAGGTETLIAGSSATPALVTKGLTAGGGIALTSDSDSVTISVSPVLACVVNNSVNITIPNGGNTNADFDTNYYDPFNMHSTLSNTNRINIIEDGFYHASFTSVISGNSGATGPVYAIMFRNSGGSNTQIAGDLSRDFGGTNATPNLNATADLNLLKDDFLFVVLYNYSGSDLNALAGGSRSLRFSVTKNGGIV